jgi:hypothetical protein
VTVVVDPRLGPTVRCREHGAHPLPGLAAALVAAGDDHLYCELDNGRSVLVCATPGAWRNG